MDWVQSRPQGFNCASAHSSDNAYHKPWFSFFVRRTEHFRLQRPAASFAARSKPWSSNATSPEPGSHNAQRNYQRYLELARAEALAGNTVGAENYYQHAE